MTARTRRQKYSIVDRSLQYRVLAIIISYSLVIVLFLAICLFVPDILSMSNEQLSWEIRAAAADRLLTLHSRVWPAIIAMVCVLGIHSVRIFHRLIGPLYRFRWAFAEIAKGALNFRVQIRKNDYLHRENDSLNEMIDALAGQCESMQQAGSSALDSLTALEHGPDKDSGRDNARSLPRFPGGTTKEGLRRGSEGRRGTRSWTPGCANYGGRDGCTTACV